VTIPASLVEEWYAIPPNARVNSTLTRQDLDHLFFGLLKLAQSEQALQSCVLEWSNSRLETANRAMFDSQRFSIEAQNELRQFIVALMVSATRKGAERE